MKFSEILTEGKVKKISVPSFKSKKELDDFIRSMSVDATPKDYVVDPESGEVIMSPGDTKRKILKKKAKNAISDIDDMAPIIYYKKGSESFDEPEMFDFYNIVMKSIRSMVDDPEGMRAQDYDIDSDMPVVIKRKDRKPLTDDDMDNIKYFQDYHNDILPDNIKDIASSILTSNS